MNTQQSLSGKCSCCSMSRRCFLASSAVGLSMPWAAMAQTTGVDDKNPGEPLDLASFRPKPAVRVMGALIREKLGTIPTTQKQGYWLGWPGTSYDLDNHRLEYEQSFIESANRLGVELSFESTPLDDDATLAAFLNKVKTEKPDAVLVHMQHLGSWGKAETVVKLGFPTIVFAPVGTAFTGQVNMFSRRPGVHVISSLETKAVEQALRMVRAKKQFEETRLLVVHGDKREETVMEHLGTKVRRIPRDTFHELFQKMPETEEAHDLAKLMRKGAQDIIEPSKQDTINAARSFVTAKRLLKMEESNAITTDCLGMVSSRAVPTPPCMAATLFQDGGITYGCEADIFGAMSLMLTSYLLDKPSFMNDPVPETYKNALIVAHCSCGAKMNGFDQDNEPYVLRSHSESNIGVSMQVIWKLGQPVTLVRFNNPKELILDTGTVIGNVNTPPAGGCRTSVEIQMDRIEDCRDVLGFHQAVFYGNHRRDIEAFCQMYGIKVINSPREAQKGPIA
ncbi:MAG TPA: hypothetical protein PLI09_26400 [Candidatus Hydrogenedentes bacterium]|nr:hypothetical protein [Candidatus Hydrogenedentota bacterium]